MKKFYVGIILVIISLILAMPIAKSQDIGSIFCWHYKEIYGGHEYLHNESIVKKGLPTDGTKWADNLQWWENLAEEIDYSGLDYVALLSRGNQPNAPDRGNGNPKHIPKLINAMLQRGVANSFKLAIFDDVPNSWTGSKNWDESGGAIYSTTNPKFDCSDPANYKYIWDYNIKQVYEHVPDEMRYKIDGRPVIFFWNLRSTWFINIEGSLKPILDYIRARCQAEFGFNPFLIVQTDWFVSDPQLKKSDVDAIHNWIKDGPQYSWTLTNENNYKIGVLAPGLRNPGESGFMDPSMGTNDNGTRLRDALENTVGAGARTTLIEGFTNAAESASLWRSNDEGLNLLYDYANQRLNAVRRYTSNPFPQTLKVEAEACDFNFDLSTGNSGGAYLDMGDLDVVKCLDTFEGWNVTNTQVNEWMEWRELPLLANTKFQLRYKSYTTASISFSVDGTALSTITLPSTSDAWATIDAGNFITSINGLHTVRLTIVSGTPDINYFIREFDSVSGIDEITNPAVRIYPNPLSQDVLYIDLGGFHSDNVLVKIINLSGQTVYQTKLSNTSHVELDLSGILKKSIYLISFESDYSKVVNKLIVK